MRISLLEKILSFTIHPRIRIALLRRAGASIGSSSMIYDIRFTNITNGFRHFNVGANTYIGDGCLFDLTHRINIGERTTIAPGCIFVTHSDPGLFNGNKLANVFPRIEQSVTLGHDCWIGAGVLILCGITVGDGSVVGGGSVVIRDVPPGVIVVGNPARIIRKIDMASQK